MDSTSKYVLPSVLSEPHPHPIHIHHTPYTLRPTAPPYAVLLLHGNSSHLPKVKLYKAQFLHLIFSTTLWNCCHFPHSLARQLSPREIKEITEMIREWESADAETPTAVTIPWEQGQAGVREGSPNLGCQAGPGQVPSYKEWLPRGCQFWEVVTGKQSQKG